MGPFLLSMIILEIKEWKLFTQQSLTILNHKMQYLLIVFLLLEPLQQVLIKFNDI